MQRKLIVGGLLMTGLLLALWVPPAPGQEAPIEPPPASPVILDELQKTLLGLFQSGEYAQAETLLKQALMVNPHAILHVYNLACAQARQGKHVEALDNLEKAIMRGFSDVAHMEADPDLASLRQEPRFATLVTMATQVAKRLQPVLHPLPIAAGLARIEPTNTFFQPLIGVFLVAHQFPEDFKPNATVITGYGPLGDRLREWHAKGSAAGLHGILYDNRDDDHSNMDYQNFPQLTRVTYGVTAIEKGLRYGTQTTFIHNMPVIGNASTALTVGPLWRSNPRIAMVNPRSMQILYNQYVANHLYVYPEHKDYDPGHNGRPDGYGDTYPANIPYVIISQGSSGTDRPFLSALACTIAAFPPETQKLLIRRGLLMPTVQMILRASNRQVRQAADYITGKAHPPVFNAGDIDPERMITMAHGMAPDQVPAMIQLSLIEAEHPRNGIDFFAVDKLTEGLFTTPAAIARVFRSTQAEQRLVVSAETSRDVNGLPLTFSWVVLTGDPQRITITPMNAVGSLATLRVGWHPRRPVSPDSKMETSRVDIGVFAHNGIHYSAPGIISFYCPDSEQREYDGDRIRKVTYTAGPDGNYVDPLVEIPKQWSDHYHYTPDGRLLGWTRQRDQQEEHFTRDGALVTRRDAQGRPLEAITLRYIAKTAPDQSPTLEQVPGEEILRYAYADDGDRLGHIAERKKLTP